MMTKCGILLNRLVDNEAGASAVEYAVLLALILMAVFLAIELLGLNVNQAFENFNARFQAAIS